MVDDMPEKVPDERRRSPRRPGLTPVLVRYPGRDGPVLGYRMNRSAGGVRLDVPLAAPVGTVLHVRDSGASAGVPWERVVVIWLREEGGRWELGRAHAGEGPL